MKDKIKRFYKEKVKPNLNIIIPSVLIGGTTGYFVGKRKGRNIEKAGWSNMLGYLCVEHGDQTFSEITSKEFWDQISTEIQEL